MSNGNAEIQVKCVDEVDRVLPRDNVVHIRRNANGLWAGAYISGRCEGNVIVRDEFATFAKALSVITRDAENQGATKLYYKKS